jgi:hypothetical protein
MNTASENAYYDLMSGDRINFKVIETREVEYDFKITPEIMNQFYQWKVDTLETTDIQPTELEMLNYFKNLRVISCGPSGYAPKIEVVEIKIIDVNEDK